MGLSKSPAGLGFPLKTAFLPDRGRGPAATALRGCVPLTLDGGLGVRVCLLRVPATPGPGDGPQANAQGAVAGDEGPDQAPAEITGQLV